MLIEKKALLLIGSPKVKNSTSETLGGYLLERLGEKGYEVEKFNVAVTLKKDIQELLEKVNKADLLIIAFPLYVDSLPAPLIKVLELIYENRKETKNHKKQSLIAVINCGFPEAFHNITALKICENFSSKVGFNWLGGLKMGEGPMVNGRPLKELGGMFRNIVKAMDITIEAIANDKEVPLEAKNMFSKGLIPAWVYTFAGNMGWKPAAKKFNAHKRLYERPYAKKS